MTSSVVSRLGRVWKRISSAVTAVAGKQPQRAGPPAAERGVVSERREAAAATSVRPRRRQQGRRARLPGHYDEKAQEIIRRVKPRTMTSHEKIFGLILATRYVQAHKVPGEIVECGVWRGGSMQTVALTLLETGSTDRHLHLFDTFEGMPPPTDKDRRIRGKSAAELMELRGRDSKLWAVATLDDVRAGMDEVGYPRDRIHYHRGLVEETVPRDAPERIAILRLDTDWYESTRHELEHLYERLSPGGVLIIDDYGGWEGSRQATEEFLARTGEPLLLLPLSGGRIAVKPWA